MNETTHAADCHWERADCEYKATHNYCPHAEHACNCKPTREIINWPKQYNLACDAAVVNLRRAEKAEAFLEREGYRQCDIAACNCGSWHRKQFA